MTTDNKPVENETPVNKDENMWAMFCHLSALVGFVIPFGNIIAPLVIWTLKKDEYPHVNDQGKEAINFQLSITVYILISVVLVFVVIGIPLLIILGIFSLIMTVIAALNANDGNKYRYPFTIKFINLNNSLPPRLKDSKLLKSYI
jgi:uncharacterized Tic20 family protein